MNDDTAKTMRERSPSFPIISLKSAVERLEKFEATFGRHPAPYKKAGMAWGIKEGSSQANQILAALKAFGFLDYQGSGNERQAFISEMGRTYLRAQQDNIKKDVLRKAALKPKQFAKFWPDWKSDRPIDPVCLDELVLTHGFNDNAAPTFLRVYDETMAFAGLTDPDKITDDFDEDGDDIPEDGFPETCSPTPLPEPLPKPSPTSVPRPNHKALTKGFELLENERVLTSGLLSKNTRFKVIVEGTISVKEIDRLIAKLEFDKEILADEGGEEDLGC